MWQKAERPHPAPALGIFLVGLLCLMVELLHTRMLSFFLGSISNFLAIPVSLFGLALGSLLVHRARNGDRPDARPLIAILQALVLPVLAVAFVGFFAVANAFFPVIHVSLESPYADAARLLVYAGIFLPPYAIFGALLALYFEEGAQSIGRLYFFDLAGAASGCLLAPLVLTWAGLPPAIMLVAKASGVPPVEGPERRATASLDDESSPRAACETCRPRSRDR